MAGTIRQSMAMRDKFGKFDDIVMNWRLMVPIILTATGLIIAIKFGIEYSLLTWDHVTTEDAQVKATKIQVSAEVGGRLRALYVEEGATVKTMDLLAELDPTTYQWEVDQTRAMLEGLAHELEAAQYDLALADAKVRGELAQAEALLARRQSEVREGEVALAFERVRVSSLVAEQRAAVDGARARTVESQALLSKALAESQRVQELVAAGIAAQERLEAAAVAHAQAAARHDQMSQQVRQAEAQLETAKASGKLVEMKTRRLDALHAEARKEKAAVQFAQVNRAAIHLKQEQIQRLHTQKRVLEARLNAAELQLARTRIRSPVDGIVLLKKAEAGEWLERGQPLLLLGDPHDLWVQTNIRESEIAEVRVGNKVQIWVDAYPELRFEGTVAWVGATALSELAEAKPSEFFTKIEQRIPVKVALQEQNEILKAGMMVWVGIQRRRPQTPPRP
jgi:membrane fusion protein (multidrug efflux system)